MLTRPQVQRYSTESGLRDIMIAEKEVALTFLLQLLSERGLLDRLAFKGGTCLRKMFTGSQGRFSTDLDFTGIEAHDHEDVILDMMQVFEQPFHGIQFSIPDAATTKPKTVFPGASIPPTSMSGMPVAVRSSSRSAGGKPRRYRPSVSRSWSRVIFNSCHLHPRPSPASPCPKSSPRRSAPATSETRRATSTTLACSRPAPRSASRA